MDSAVNAVRIPQGGATVPLLPSREMQSAPDRCPVNSWQTAGSATVGATAMLQVTAADEADCGFPCPVVDGTPATGDSELSFTVEVDGKVVQTEPYLGAAGHLVAVRNGDLAYLHVHPHDGGTTSAVVFTAEFPSAGTYRLFFDYSHDGTVRTASFTVDVATSGETDTMTTHQEGH